MTTDELIAKVDALLAQKRRAAEDERLMREARRSWDEATR